MIYLPKPDIHSAVNIGTSFITDWGQVALLVYGGGIMTAHTLHTGWLNRRRKKQGLTLESAVGDVSLILQILAQVPGGMELVEKAKSALKSKQVNAGVWDEINAILKRRGMPTVDPETFLNAG